VVLPAGWRYHKRGLQLKMRETDCSEVVSFMQSNFRESKVVSQSY